MFLAGGKGMTVFDLSDPSVPGRILEPINTGCTHSQSGCDILLIGDTLIVGGGTGAQLFDVSNPTRPTKSGDNINTGALSTNGGVQLMQIDEYVYCLGGNGLSVCKFDISENIGPL